MVNDLVGVTTHGYHMKSEGKRQGSQRGDNNYPKNQALSLGDLGSMAV